MALAALLVLLVQAAACCAAAAMCAAAVVALRRAARLQGLHALALVLLGASQLEPVVTFLGAFTMKPLLLRMFADVPLALRMAAPSALASLPVLGLGPEGGFYRDRCLRTLAWGLARWSVWLAFLYYFQRFPEVEATGPTYLCLFLGAVLLAASAVFGWRELQGPLAEPGRWTAPGSGIDRRAVLLTGLLAVGLLFWASLLPDSRLRGFRGVVEESGRDGEEGIRLVRAVITFRSEHLLEEYVTTSDRRGRYVIELPPERYWVSVRGRTLPSVSVGTGFFVVKEPGIAAANIFLSPGYTGAPHAARPQASRGGVQADKPPTVTITVDPPAVKAGQAFTVTVSAEDDVGLAALWWWGENTGDPGLDSAHWFDCLGQRSATKTWTVSTLRTGTLTLKANARDTAYKAGLGRPHGAHQASEGQGQGFVTVRVE